MRARLDDERAVGRKRRVDDAFRVRAQHAEHRVSRLVDRAAEHHRADEITQRLEAAALDDVMRRLQPVDHDAAVELRDDQRHEDFFSRYDAVKDQPHPVRHARRAQGERLEHSPQVTECFARRAAEHASVALGPDERGERVVRMNFERFTDENGGRHGPGETPAHVLGDRHREPHDH